MEFTENCIEFLTGESVATVTLSQREQITKFKKLHREHPTEVDYIENPDGSICEHFPVAWLRIHAPRQLSEEQKDRLRASFAKNVGSTRGNPGQIRPEQMEVNNG